MKKIVILILVLSLSFLFSGELQDFKFIIGLYGDGNIDLAAKEIQNFKVKYPESNFSFDADYILANIHLESKNYSKADKLFSKLGEQNKKPIILPNIILGRAETSFHLKEFSTSESFLEKFKKNFSSHKLNWKYYELKAKLFEKNSNKEQAVAAYTKAFELSQKTKYHPLKMRLLFQTNQLSKADNFFSFIKRNQDEFSNQAKLIYKKNLLEQKSFKKITRLQNDLIKKDSKYYEKNRELDGIALYKAGKYKEAEKRLAPADNNYQKGMYYLALTKMKLNKNSEAEDILSFLYENGKNNEIRTNSLFFSAKIKSEYNPQTAINLLKKFIQNNPKHKFIAEAHYQNGYISYQQKNYSSVLKHISKSLELKLPEQYHEISYLMLTNSAYQLEKYKTAGKWLNIYLEKFPNGEYLDELTFKKALIAYENGDNSLTKKILLDFLEKPGSLKYEAEISYILGEIYLEEEKFAEAISFYQKAQNKVYKTDFIWKRKTQIFLKLEDYRKAHISVDHLKDSDNFGFDYYLLKGNIYFAQKNYDNALQMFEKTKGFLEYNSKEKEIKRKIAWTLYHLKRYEEAEKIYSNLSKDGKRSAKLLLLAASSAFNNDNYVKAVKNYNEFIKNFPDHQKRLEALIGIADSYYNNKNFGKAAKFYKKILVEEKSDSTYFRQSLNGIEWSSLRADSLDYYQEFSQLLEEDINKDLKEKVYIKIISYEYNQELWKNVITSAAKYFNLYPQTDNFKKIKLMQANSFLKLNQTAKAEKTFLELEKKFKDPEIYYQLYVIAESRDKEKIALRRLKAAAALSENQTYWLKLLTLEKKLNDENFSEDYMKFMKFAKGLERQEAKIIYIEWNVDNHDYDKARSLINSLEDSQFDKIKASSQYWHGYILYKQGRFEEAIPELLRVRYLYPDIVKIKNEAEKIALDSYILNKDKKGAEQLYDKIKESLEEDKKNEFLNKLEGLNE